MFKFLLFVLLIGVPKRIASSSIGLNICVITAGVKTVSLAKDKLNTIEVLIPKFLSNSYIYYNEFVSVNNVLKDYDIIKKVTKNPKTFNSGNEYAWNIQTYWWGKN